MGERLVRRRGPRWDYIIGVMALLVLLAWNYWPRESSGGDVGVGSTVSLSLPQGGNVYLAVDERSLDELMDAAFDGNDAGISKLIGEGRVFPVRAGTSARVIDRSLFRRKVRLLGGHRDGAVGWVPKDWTH